MQISEFDKVWGIFEEAFSEAGRRSKEKQFDLLSNPLYNLDTYEEDGRIVAYIAYWNFDNFLYVEHLATDSSMRGRGIGGKMLRDLMTKQEQLTVLESEIPHDEISTRRISFYERLSFEVNGYDYVQPPYNDAYEELPLAFLSRPRLLSKEEFEAARQTIYQEVYNRDI